MRTFKAPRGPLSKPCPCPMPRRGWRSSRGDILCVKSNRHFVAQINYIHGKFRDEFVLQICHKRTFSNLSCCASNFDNWQRIMSYYVLQTFKLVSLLLKPQSSSQFPYGRLLSDTSGGEGGLLQGIQMPCRPEFPPGSAACCLLPCRRCGARPSTATLIWTRWSGSLAQPPLATRRLGAAPMPPRAPAQPAPAPGGNPTPWRAPPAA